jgi:hypothetical protein
LKGHAAIAAYNIVNEPAPEKEGGLAEHADQATMSKWYGAQRDGPRDLLAFYKTIIAAIREVDTKTPIMVDSGWYAAADAFQYWPAPLDDPIVLYSFHMYEPYQATSGPNLKRKRPYTYPGEVPFSGGSQYWDNKRVAEYLSLPGQWARTFGVPSTRMVAGEFGCVRMLDSCATYLDDVLASLDRQTFHWSFYSFREDSWDGMDYELGKGKVPWQYWDAMEKNLPDPVQRKNTFEFDPIARRLAE